MELKIKEEKDAPLLSRKDIVAEISFKGATPSKTEARKRIASALKADEKLIIVKKIRTSFGSENAEVIACQYSSEETLKSIEPKEKAKKEKAPKEKAAKGEKKAE